MINLSNTTIFYKSKKPIIKELDGFSFSEQDTLNLKIQNKDVIVYESHPDLYSSFFNYSFYYYPINSVDIEINTMSLAINYELKNKWNKIAQLIESNKHKIDKTVYSAFNKLQLFLSYHPFPKNNKYGEVQESDWNSERIEEWRELNTRLSESIEVFEELKE